MATLIDKVYHHLRKSERELNLNATVRPAGPKSQYEMRYPSGTKAVLEYGGEHDWGLAIGQSSRYDGQAGRIRDLVAVNMDLADPAHFMHDLGGRIGTGFFHTSTLCMEKDGQLYVPETSVYLAPMQERGLVGPATGSLQIVHGQPGIALHSIRPTAFFTAALNGDQRRGIGQVLAARPFDYERVLREELGDLMLGNSVSLFTVRNALKKAELRGKERPA